MIDSKEEQILYSAWPWNI